MRLSRRLADAARSPARAVGFAGRIGEILWRGELRSMLKRMRPRSPSIDEYRAWRAAQSAASAPLHQVPFVVALDTLDDAARSRLIDAFAPMPPGAVRVLVRARGGGWTEPAGGRERSLAEWLEALAARWIWWTDRPLRLEPGASHAIAEACSRPSARVVYADHDLEDDAGRPLQPVLKSAWDPEQVLERPYAGPLLVVHATLAAQVDAARDAGAGGTWGFLVNCVAALPRDAIVHVPRVLQHVPSASAGYDDSVDARRAVTGRVLRIAALRGDAIEANPERTPWLRYRVPAECTTSIVIPTRNRLRLLRRCVESIVAHGIDARTEIVVVDNGSTDRRVAKFLREMSQRTPMSVVPMAVPFNFSKLCNAGVAAARGRVVVLLNNDTEVIDPHWLVELVSLAARANIGAVGPLLVYPDRRIQSAGVLLGVNRGATSALSGFDANDPVARAWCAARRQVSTVMGACLAVERRKYRHVGGMDERFAVSHNELDFGLRLEAEGWTNLFTPFTSVVHKEGGTRGFDVTFSERRRLRAEEAQYRARWGHVTSATDPAHHPALARDGNPFDLVARYVPRPRAGWREDNALPAGQSSIAQA